MNKKQAGMLLLSTVILLSACNGGSGDKGTDTGSGPGDTAETGGSSEALEIAYPSWWEDWFVDLKKDFEAANKGVNVVLIPLYDDPTTKQAMMMQSADTAPDVAVEDTYILNSDVNAGYLDSLQKMVDTWDDWQNFEETVKQGGMAENGEIYGIPFSTDVQGLWYNREIFKNAGLPEDFQPTSWADILKAAQTIKEKQKDVIPLFVYSTKATGEATSMRTFQVLYNGTGSELYDQDEGKWVADEKALIDTFGFIDAVYKEKLGPSLSMASNSQIGTLLAEETMPTNGVAMVMDGNWVAGTWRRGDTAEPYENAMDVWGFIPFPTQKGDAPKYTSMSGGWAFSIPANAQNKDLAEAFIKMAVDKEHQSDYVFQTGDMTVRTDVAEDEEYLNQPISNYEEANEILEYTHFRPTVDDYPTVSTHIQEVVEGVASGNYSPEEAAKQYIEGLTRIVGQENIIQR